MDLLIMSLLDAGEYEPNKPTGVIRIFSAYQKGDKIWERPMVDSPLYKHIRTYYFDDVVFFDFVRENEIFCLGQDADELKREYNKFRRYIYETLKDVAQTLKLS